MDRSVITMPLEQWDHQCKLSGELMKKVNELEADLLGYKAICNTLDGENVARVTRALMEERDTFKHLHQKALALAADFQAEVKKVREENEKMKYERDSALTQCNELQKNNDYFKQLLSSSGKKLDNALANNKRYEGIIEALSEMKLKCHACAAYINEQIEQIVKRFY